MSAILGWIYTRNQAKAEGTVTLSPSPESSVEIVDLAVPDESTDLEAVLAVDVSQAVAIYMHSTTALTVETNSSSAADDTITLAANVPLLWCTGAPFTNPVTTDITALYLTNASGSDAVFNVRVLQDATP